MREETKGFIDFILAAEQSMELTQGFLKAKTAAKLKKFFKENGYEGIGDEECAKIIKAVKALPPDVLGPDQDLKCY